MTCFEIIVISWPYKFVGIRDIASKFFCILKASQSLIPAILAIAYHSLVLSSSPSNNDSSLIGCKANFG